MEFYLIYVTNVLLFLSIYLPIMYELLYYIPPPTLHCTVWYASLKNNYSLSGGGRWPASIAYARVGGERHWTGIIYLQLVYYIYLLYYYTTYSSIFCTYIYM